MSHVWPRATYAAKFKETETYLFFLLRIEIATHTRGGFSSGAGVHERGFREADHALFQSELPGER